MKISTYISISTRKGVERSLLEAPYLFRDILEYTQNVVLSTLGEGVTGILCPLFVSKDVLTEVPRIPLFRQGQYRDTEFDTLAAYAPALESDWTVILRPLCGWIHASRFKQVIDCLPVTSYDSILSTVPLSSLGHPTWNCSYAPGKYEHDNCFVISHLSEDVVSTVDKKVLKNPTSICMNECHRSQDLSVLHNIDESLFAVRTDRINDKSFLKEHTPGLVSCDTVDPNCPWYFNLPVHELHDQCAIDFSDIEAHLASRDRTA